MPIAESMSAAALSGPSKSRSAPGLTCRIERDFESLEGIRARWDEAVTNLGGPLYMSFDWLRLWWKYYGQEKPLRLFVFEQQNQIVALIPTYLETFWCGPLKTVVARLVGANIPPRAFDPPIDPAAAEAVLHRLVSQLFGEDKCDLLALGPVTRNWSGQETLHRACRGAANLVSEVQYQPAGVVTLFSLPDTFEKYLESLSSSERKNRRKRIRALEKAYEIQSQIVSDSTAAIEEFENFLKQHAAQWKTEGKGGHFGSWPEGEAFHRDLVTAHAALGRLKFFRLLANGNVVVNRYTYCFGGVLYSELPARAVGEEWDRLGIGSTSMVKFFESAIGAGFRNIDSGPGSYEHKVQLGGTEITIGTWHLVGNRFGTEFRIGLLKQASALMKLVFHKIWYRRIVPRIPGKFGRTQCRFWLRFEI